MSRRHWLAFYPVDFRAKTLDLTVEQIGAYFLLLMAAWVQPDATLPNDMRFIRRLFGSMAEPMHGHTFNRLVPPILKRYFTLGPDNRWHNKRLSEEYFKALKLSANAKQKSDKWWSTYRQNKYLADATAKLTTATYKEEGGQQEIKVSDELMRRLRGTNG